MYAYYAVKASGRNPPRWIAKSITTIQLSQMFVGIFLNYMAIRALMRNKTCEMSPFSIGISIFFYTSYAVLFGNFFYWTYVYNKPRVSKCKRSSEPAQCNGVSGGVKNGVMTGSSRNSTVTLQSNGEHKA